MKKPPSVNRAIAALVTIAFTTLVALSAIANPAITITFDYTAPETHMVGTELIISGPMTNANEVEVAYLYYRVRGAAIFQKLEMDLLSAQEFEASISGNEIRLPVIELYVLAIDFLENKHFALGSPRRPITIRIIAARAESSHQARVVSSSSTTMDSLPNAISPLPTDAATATGQRSTDNGQGQMPPDAATDTTPGSAWQEALVLERDWIVASGARTLVDLLQFVPGLYVSRDVSGGYHVSMSGIAVDGGVLLTVAGHRLNALYDGATAWTLPAWMIERVLVLRGPASFDSGEGALAGMVTVELVSGMQGLAFRSRAGSHLSSNDNLGQLDPGPNNIGSYSLDGAGGLSFGAINFTLLGGLAYGSGVQRLIASDFLSATGLSSTPTHTRDTAIQTAWALNGLWDAGSKGTLSWGAQLHYDKREGYIGKLNTAGPGSDLRRRALLLHVEHRLPLTPTADIEIRAYLGHHAHDRLFMLAPPDYHTADTNGDGEDERFPAGLQERLAFSTLNAGVDMVAGLAVHDNHRFTLGLGADYQHLSHFIYQRNARRDGSAAEGLGEYDFKPLAGPYEEDGVGRPRVYLSAKDHMHLGSALSADLGLRFDYVGESPISEAYAVGIYLTPQASISYLLLDQLLLDLAFRQGFRAPTIADRYDARGVITGHYGDLSIAPSVCRLLQAGVEHAGPSAIGTFRFKLALYYQWVQGAVYRVYDYPLPQPLTIANLHGPGLSMEIRLDLTRTNFLCFSGGWWRKQVTGHKQVPGGGGYITDQPQITASVRARFDIGNLAELSLSGLYASERRNNVRTAGERERSWSIPQFFRADIALRSKLLWRHLRVGLYMYNLFDTDQRDVPPRPEHLPDMVPRQGLSVLLGLEVE